METALSHGGVVHIEWNKGILEGRKAVRFIVDVVVVPG